MRVVTPESWCKVYAMKEENAKYEKHPSFNKAAIN